MLSLITLVLAWLAINFGIISTSPSDEQIQQYQQETGTEWVGDDGGAGRS